MNDPLPVELTPPPVPAAETLLRTLLPRFYWLRDAQLGSGTLEALIAALAKEYDGLQREVRGLYDDMFIQTCAPELVSYFGEGVGLSGLVRTDGTDVSDRAWIGRITAFRQTKGTLATIARAATAATGWPAFVQDGRTVTAHTQSMAFPRADEGRVAMVSGRRRGGDGDTPEPWLDDAPPWSRVTRGASFTGAPARAGSGTTLDPAAPAGYPAPLTVEVAVWRLESLWVSGREPKPADAPRDLAGRAFTFDPTGLDVPLFASPDRRGDLDLPPRASAIPAPLTRSSLREALATSSDPAGPPLAISIRCGQGGFATIPHDEIAVADLRDWDESFPGSASALVDPLLGRLLLPVPPSEVRVSYAYGFPGEIGGGPYGTQLQRGKLDRSANTLTLYVGKHLRHREGSSFTTLDAALRKAAELLRAGFNCHVLIANSATHRPGEPGRRLVVPPGQHLRIGGDAECAPVIDGVLDVTAPQQARFELTSLTITELVSLHDNGLLEIEHCALSPRAERSLHVTGAAAVTIADSVVGGVAAGGGATLAVKRGATGPIGVDGPIRTADLVGVTVLGETHAETLVAEDCIFTKHVRCSESGRSHGLIRSSYLAPGGTPPHARVACQPADDASNVRPLFTSTRWGDPAFCQLQLACPPEIASGATHGEEMGAWSWLRQPTRFARMAIVVDEMVPAGVAASVRYCN